MGRRGTHGMPSDFKVQAKTAGTLNTCRATPARLTHGRFKTQPHEARSGTPASPKVHNKQAGPAAATQARQDTQHRRPQDTHTKHNIRKIWVQALPTCRGLYKRAARACTHTLGSSAGSAGRPPAAGTRCRGDTAFRSRDQCVLAASHAPVTKNQAGTLGWPAQGT